MPVAESTCVDLRRADIIIAKHFQERAHKLQNKITTYNAPAAESTLAAVIIAKQKRFARREQLKFKNIRV